MNNIKLSSIIILAGTFIALFYCFAVNNYTEWGYPFNSFLVSSSDKFMDFYNVNYFIDNLDPYSLEKNVSYPPFALLLAYPFSLFFSYTKYGSVLGRNNVLGIISYLLVVLPFIYFLTKEIYKSIKGSNKIDNIIYTIILLLSYPVLFLLDRGNYLLLSFIFTYLFVHYYNTNPNKSVFFLSLSIATKIYPIVFVLLFLVDKRYKDFFKTAIITAFISFIPLFFLKGTVISNIANFLNNLFSFSDGHVSGAGIMEVFKIPIEFLNGGILPTFINQKYILYFSILILFVLVIYLLQREKELSLRICYLIVAQILVMPPSFDYNFIYLFIPLLMILKHNNMNSNNNNTFYVVVISLLFIPKPYIILLDKLIWNIPIECFVNPFLSFYLILYPIYVFYKMKRKSYKIQNC